MKVTDEQLDAAAQAVSKADADLYHLWTAWAALSNQTKDDYRKMALAVLATLPDAPEPIEGKRRFVAARSKYGSWQVMEEPTPGDYLHHGASFSNKLPADCAAAMIRAAADAAERWHRAQKAKEPSGPFEARLFGGEAWIVVDTRSGNRVATHLPDYSQMEAAAKRDAAERNARLDAEEGHD